MRCFVLLVFTAAACQSTPAPANLGRVQQLYEDGLNGAASRAASVMLRDEAPSADIAAWYGGLAEVRRGNDAASRAFFERAAHAPNPDVAGGAEAMLGQLAEGRADDQAALRHYDTAWTLLDGSDQRQVATRAEAIAANANMSNTKAMWAGRLRPEATTPTGGFALQAGAYSTRASATAHARTLSTQTVRAGIGPATVRHRRSSGGSLWLVQCGDFTSRAEASAAKRRLPSVAFVVARMQP